VAGAAASVAGDTPLRGLLTLRSSRPSVTIPGSQSTSGPLRLHLTWSTLPTDQRSLQAGLRRSTDVHLGVLWETNDGHQGVVQSLGDSFLAPGWGSTLLRLGPRSETEGETVTVALNHVHALKRLVAFAYAYVGNPEWDALAVQLTAELRGGVEVQMGLDPAPADAGVAVLASVHRVGSELVLRREAAYLRGQQSAVAAAYGWDLPWASGRTVPRRPR
jgi:tellurite resistance protein TerA